GAWRLIAETRRGDNIGGKAIGRDRTKVRHNANAAIYLEYRQVGQAIAVHRRSGCSVSTDNQRSKSSAVNSQFLFKEYHNCEEFESHTSRENRASLLLTTTG